MRVSFSQAAPGVADLVAHPMTTQFTVYGKTPVPYTDATGQSISYVPLVL